LWSIIGRAFLGVAHLPQHLLHASGATAHRDMGSAALASALDTLRWPVVAARAARQHRASQFSDADKVLLRAMLEGD
jgi:hypothetical protein